MKMQINAISLMILTGLAMGMSAGVMLLAVA
jgi:hypothetical protein